MNYSILAFSTIFRPIKVDMSGNTVWPQASGFQKIAKIDHSWNFQWFFVNVARSANNVQWDFLCDFQTPCLFRDWHHLQLAFAIGSLSLVSYFFVIPESPRWLVSKNRVQEAQELLWLLAKKNGIDAKRTRLAEYFDALKSLKESQATNSQNGSTLVLAKNAVTNSEYLKRTFLLIPPFFAVGVA